MIKEDWIECAFEDLLDYEQPTSYIIKEEEYNDKYSIPVLTAGKGFIKGYTKEKFGIFDKLPTIIFDDFTTATQFVNFPFKVKSSAMKILIPKSDLVNLKFVFGAMQVNKVRAETHKRYWISEYSKLRIPLPPLPIQRAIVKKIEQLFSALDAGIADLKKAQEQLKVYRQAVLKRAFEGDWEIKKIKDVCENIKVGIVIKPTRFYSHDKAGIRVFRSANVKEFRIENSNWIYFTKSGNEQNARTKLREDDVLIVRSGYPGTSCIVTNEYAGTNAIDILIATPDKDQIFSKFLCAFNNSPFGKGLFAEGSRGVAQKHLNVGVYSNLTIPIPSLKEQLQIVREIESRLSVCDALEQQINTSLQQADALRQSILKKAFAGELLTAAEIAACKKEPDYEPASVLLQRIKSEKEKGRPKISKGSVEPKVKSVIANVPKVSADIHAGLIAKIIKLHEANPVFKDKLSHIKCEKLAHLVEYHVRIPLGRRPVKDAAGPDDYRHLKNIESRAGKAGFFKQKKRPIGYTYVPGNNMDKVISKFESSVSDEQNAKVNALLQLFLPFDLETAEIAATTYAGWNNLIILGNSHPSDEEIVTASRENWSKRKLTIPRERFFKAIDWLRKKEINLIPTGYGLFVSTPAKKKK